MKETEFVSHFAAQFEDADPSSVRMDTRFREIEGWSSFAALSIIAMIDEVYSRKISGNDIRSSVTVRDIYNLVVNEN